MSVDVIDMVPLLAGPRPDFGALAVKKARDLLQFLGEDPGDLFAGYLRAPRAEVMPYHWTRCKILHRAARVI
jgi:hypothetical protein